MDLFIWPVSMNKKKTNWFPPENDVLSHRVFERGFPNRYSLSNSIWGGYNVDGWTYTDTHDHDIKIKCLMICLVKLLFLLLLLLLLIVQSLKINSIFCFVFMFRLYMRVYLVYMWMSQMETVYKYGKFIFIDALKTVTYFLDCL